MADIARFLRFDNQPPLIRLFLSFCTVIITGTLFFRVLILCGSLMFGLEPGKMVQLPPGGHEGQISYILKYVQFSQQTGLFLIPSLLIAWLMNEGAGAWLRTGKWPKALPVLMAVILPVVIIPVINYTGFLNSKLELPGSMSGVQHWMRSREDSAAYLTSKLIASPGLFTFMVNLFILAILPSVCEEFLFRGVIQRLLSEFFRSSHAGIWVTAVIFSSVHLQFFGFVPRMMLGLLFGYMFWWSRNLWYPVITHFVNNAIPVTVAWLNGWKSGVVQPAETGERIPSVVFAAIISALLLYYFWSQFRMRSAPSGDLPAGSGNTGN